ncbi:MAG: signal peptidase I [Planctomycetaceae bacterium]|jgi:signal peptidase I|nr:signal peptidase I [Planctomycetaceae bacterium]
MEEQKFYRYKWIGVLCAIMLPGSAHFLAGRKMLGIFLFCGFMSLNLLRRFIASIPGEPFGVLAVFLLFVLVVYVTLLLVFSWRPIRRLGYRGWILFVLFVPIFNHCIHPMIEFFTQNVAGFNRVAGSTMSPTLCPSTKSPPRFADVIASNSWIYYRNNPKRGDIVKFRVYKEDGKADPLLWAKRVVGLPGETIDIAPPYVLINGKRLIEPDIFRKISESLDGFNGYRFVNSNNRIDLPITLGDDEYFLLGDNSEKSVDSRTFGSVKRHDIKSKVIRIVFPLSRIKEIE